MENKPKKKAKFQLCIFYERKRCTVGTSRCTARCTANTR